MALIELKTTNTATGNMRDSGWEFEYEYVYNAWLFNTDTRQVVTREQYYWEPTQYQPPNPYLKPISEPVFSDCLANAHTLRTWFHDGDGGVTVADEENAAACGYVSPDQPEPPKNCVAEYEFDIKPSRGVRYRLELQDLNEEWHRTDWLEEGYTGPIEYLCGSADPVTISWQGTSNKLETVRGSGLDVTLLADYGQDDLPEAFWVSDERKFKINHYRNEQLYWTGWHMPDIYREPLRNTPFHFSVQAYDGLAALQNMKYLDAQGGRYYGRARAVDILFRCLRKLDLSIPVWLAVNVWEDTTDLNIEPLSQVYFDQSQYYNEDNEPLTCKEVIDRLLQPYNAFIKQANGALHILRYNEMQGPYLRRKANMGQGDTTVTVDEATENFEELFEIRYDSETEYRENVQEVTTLPAFKEVTTVLEYGLYENFVLNGDMEQWTNDAPLFWVGTLPVYRLLEDKGNKFQMGFSIIRPYNVPRVERISNSANLRPIRSDLGYTFSFDYTLLIDDFADDKLVEWLVLPELNLANGVLSVANPFYALPRLQINGEEFELTGGTIRSNIPFAQANHRRVDAVYTIAGGYTYVQGTESRVADLIPSIPDNAVVVTYITFDDKEARFGSIYWNTFHYAELRPKISIGGFFLDGRVEEMGPARPLAWVEGDRSLWLQLENNAEYKNGIHTFTGTVVVHTQRLNTPGLLTVDFDAPQIYRDSIRGVSFAIDNVRVQERDTTEGIERVIIKGTNAGQINTEPFTLELFHGSGIPRTEALITLADGQPANTFNGGRLLQENAARDILNQHSRALLTLSATVTAGISPLAVVKDPFFLYNRFFIDKFVYSVKSTHVAIEAIEVLGGIDDMPPEGAMLYEDGRPMRYEDGDYMLYES